jgi:hypothetical protein
MKTVKAAAATCTRPMYHEIDYALSVHPYISISDPGSTHLHITKPVEIDLLRKLLLDRPRSRTARPTPQIIAFPVLVLLRAVQARSHNPDDKIANHDYPCKHRRDDGCPICMPDAPKQIAQEDDEVE